MSRDEHDRRRWDAAPPVLTDGWTRVPTTARQDMFDALPDDVSEAVDRPLLVEWRPSIMGGWGPAAVWYGPIEVDR